jgi:crossover junction endodeoxyribonuclease RusA
MKQVFQLPLPPPASQTTTNVKGPGRVKTAKYKAWRNEAGWEINLQKVKPVSGRYHIDLEITPPDRRARDADNLKKGVYDVLKEAGIIQDDSNKYMASWSGRWNNPGKAGVRVTIEEVRDE